MLAEAVDCADVDLGKSIKCSIAERGDHDDSQLTLFASTTLKVLQWVACSSKRRTLTSITGAEQPCCLKPKTAAHMFDIVPELQVCQSVMICTIFFG